MCYSIDPRDRRYVKGCGFSSFAKISTKSYLVSIVKKLLTVLKNLQQIQ